MIFYKNRRWHMCGEQVRYTQHGAEITQYVGAEGKDWWLDFAKKWEHTEIIEFIDISSTDEQLKRLEEINRLNIKEGFGAECSNYVQHGMFPDGINHILRNLQIERENIQLGIELSEREINEIIQGQQISEIEIQLLILGGM